MVGAQYRAMRLRIQIGAQIIRFLSRTCGFVGMVPGSPPDIDIDADYFIS
jgi:hypothetical protein